MITIPPGRPGALAAGVGLGIALVLAPVRPAAARAAAVEAVASPPMRRVALLPFTSTGPSQGAWPVIRAALEPRLRRVGLETADVASVEAALRGRRLRDLSLLTREEIREVASALGAERLVMGRIYRLEETGEPRVGIAGWLVDPQGDRIESMGVGIVEAADTLGPLGSGGPATLEGTLAEAARRVAAGLAGEAGEESDRASLRAMALAPDPDAYFAPAISGRGALRVTVLPFRAPAGRLGGGQAAADMFALALLASGRITLVDAGDPTRRLLARGWRTGMPVGREEVLALSRDPGVDAVVMGTVDRWIDAAGGGDAPPQVSLSARLLDTTTGEILWMAAHERRGDQTRTLYDFGNVRRAEALLGRAAAEMLDPLTRRLGEKPRRPEGEAP